MIQHTCPAAAKGVGGGLIDSDGAMVDRMTLQQKTELNFE